MGRPDRLDQLDYYTLLSITDGASADDVRDAFHTFAKKFHPDRHVGGPEAKIERAAQIFRRGAEAYRVLLDPELRRRYDEGLKKGRLRLKNEVEDVKRSRPGGSTTHNYLLDVSQKARPFVQRAAVALKKGDYGTARLNLKIAASHEPDNEVIQLRLRSVEMKMKKQKR